MASDLRVRFWGVRGSIPVPGAGTLAYGGNTSCVAVWCGERLVILDAGSGLRALGRALVGGPEPLSLDLLLTHCHVDHMIGLPFFAPAFDPRTDLRLWAGHLTPDEKLVDVVAQFMIPPLLPITPDKFRARITYHDVMAGEQFGLGDAIAVSTAPLDHPGGATAYRIDHAGRSIAYVTDTEHRGGPPDPVLVALAQDTDLMIYDAMFTPDEYPARVGWGHSTWDHGVALAEAAGVGQLALFHHAPERDDVALAAIERAAAAARPGTFAACEGLELVFPGR